MGNDVGLYKKWYGTWLSTRPRNQPRSWSAVYVSFFFLYSQVGLAWSLSHGSYQDFLCIFSPLGYFVAGFSGLHLTAFVL